MAATSRMQGLKTLTLLLLIVTFIGSWLGCGKPKAKTPPVVRITDVLRWESPYRSKPVEEDLDGKWQPVEGRLGLYHAYLENTVPTTADGVDASASWGGKTVKPSSATSISSLKPGECLVVPEVSERERLFPAVRNNGKVSCFVYLRHGPISISVTARGRTALEIPAHMVFHWNEAQIAEFDVAEGSFQPYTATAEAKDGTNVLEIEFNNDYWKPPEDRNLYLNEAHFRRTGSVFASVEDGDGAPRDFVLTYIPRSPLFESYRRAEPAVGIAESGEWRYYRVGNDTRPAIPLPAPGEIEFHLPSAGRILTTAVGLVRNGPDWRNEGDLIELLVASGENTVATRTIRLSPETNRYHRGWIEARFNLHKRPDGPLRLIVKSRKEKTGESDGNDPKETGNLVLMTQPTVLNTPDPAETRRNVILISLDTLRGDHLGSLGYGRNTSPNLDRFGNENFNFVNVSSQSTWTLPSHITMFTSLYPTSHGIMTGFQCIGNIDTIAGILRKKNYGTKGIVDGGFMSAEYAFCLGFDSYEEYDHVGLAVSGPSAEKWLRNNHQRPFFLFLHTYDTHFPYSPPKEYRDLYEAPEGASPDMIREIPKYFVDLRSSVEQALKNPVSQPDLQHLVNIYDAEIRIVDDKLQMLFDLLKDLDLWDNTMIVVTSDHGEKFMEHGELGHAGKNLYEEVTHVPLMIRVPGMKGLGILKERAETVDILPTIMDWLDIETDSVPQGESLLPIMAGTASGERPSFTENLERAAYRSGNKKLIYWENEEERTELYDLEADPLEKKNLADQEKDPVLQMEKVVKSFRERNRKIAESITAESVDLDEELTNELRNLGYMGTK